jgi:hypothetical protein
MPTQLAVALVPSLIASTIAVVVPLVSFRLALRQDHSRWLREQRAQLYVNLRLLVASLSVHTGCSRLPEAALDRAGYPEVLVLPVTVLVARQLRDIARQLRIGIAEQTTSDLAAQLRLLGPPECITELRHRPTAR